MFNLRSILVALTAYLLVSMPLSGVFALASAQQPPNCGLRTATIYDGLSNQIQAPSDDGLKRSRRCDSLGFAPDQSGLRACPAAAASLNYNCYQVTSAESLYPGLGRKISYCWGCKNRGGRPD